MELLGQEDAGLQLRSSFGSPTREVGRVDLPCQAAASSHLLRVSPAVQCEGALGPELLLPHYPDAQPRRHTGLPSPVLTAEQINQTQALGAGQLAAGTCEIVTLDRDSSQPRRTIARQTARCACRKGQIAGTTRARPACVDARIIKTKQWCDMLPCLEGEGCDLLINRSGWTCTQPGGRIKTTTVS
ncbi:PREDICTED: protein FAM19A5 [Colobus angolensis palliatus]|uniref:protein FAM19A5 n=1 Tax=Colobus angolensis palliatus TaxID=336983 RepID=UPI0005F39D43|nr:PREDICTED: protein FAM19A5 [Colobus angolensis palliatus]